MSESTSNHDPVYGHWDAETIGFDMHPTNVYGVGAVRTTQGLSVSGNPVKFIEVWDGSADAGDPIGCAGIRPSQITHEAQIPHARWALVFTAEAVSLHATALAAPAPWGED